SFGTGYVGALTRAELNALYGCSSTSSTTTTTEAQTFQCPSGWVCAAPAQQTPVTYSCPTGWICTPMTPAQTANSTGSTPSITSISVTSGVPGTSVVV